ncbi:MAG: 4Fe-4S dicluster domain-containing protein, partial [Methanocellales archaeon]|nr:4Fe-4S dicluster domain-containing protein [Methanocellales archaeon]
VSVEDSRIRRWLVSRGYGKLARSKKQLKEDELNGSAVMCVQCGKCLEKCPQEINIPEELKKVHAIIGKHKKISE